MARGAWQPTSNESGANVTDCPTTKEDRTYGSRPLAETEEAHGLIKGLEGVFDEEVVEGGEKGGSSDRK